MKCPGCGRELPNDAKFCSYCGTSIVQVDSNGSALIDDPAHQTTYSGAFSQPVSGSNGTSKINMKGGVGDVRPQMDPKQQYKSCVITLSIAIVFAAIGLVMGIFAVDPANKNDSILFAFAFAFSFFGLLGFFLFWIGPQIKIAKAKPYGGFIDWIPAVLAAIDLGVTIPALIYAFKAFQMMLA